MDVADTLAGKVIMVVVEGKEYPTYIDDHGVQRFPKNGILNYMFYHDKVGNAINDMDVNTARMLDINALSIAFQKGKLDKREWLEFNMALGFSVSSLSRFTEFQDWHFENPLWTRPSRAAIMLVEHQTPPKRRSAP